VAWLLLVCTTLGIGCRSQPKRNEEAKPQADPACVQNCELRSKELACEHPELCRENCLKVAQATACKKPLDDFMACALKEPKEHWECSGKGIPVLEHRACENQQDDMLLCLQKSEGKL
jgi:hypothetical protein